MKLTVRSDLCRGHGRCYALAEDFLEDDDEGFVTVRGQTVEVPEDQVDDVRNAAGSCPEGAITIIDD
jgi:ferredoxin